MFRFIKRSKAILVTLLSIASLLLIYSIITLGFTKDEATTYFKIPQENRKISFNDDIRPIINEKCISCHGGVKQSGGFSLLFAEDALRPNESGKPAIVPGKPEKSEMISRITSHDPEIRMPLEKEALTEKEIKLLTRWVEEGAKWEVHWAYIKPKNPVIPNLTSGWIQNKIDNFILESLQENEMDPSPPANKETLLRRVSLDLTGLPPTQEALQKFLQDNSSSAYEKMVDDLLASPQYGERWTSMWMDLARYADSKGYEKDDYRNIWKYRDWLIKAFNEDKPYNDFIIEQLSGDLLPEHTDEQLIATAFHRNTLSNDEGGTENEEYRVAAIIDRVNTTWNALQGTTMECVQCHSHPTEPIRHEGFYKSYAFFNNTADEDLSSDSPNLKTFTTKENQEKLENVKAWIVENSSTETTSEKVAKFINLIRLTEPKIHAHSFDKIKKGTSNNLNLKMDNGGQARIQNVPLDSSNRMLIRAKIPQINGKIEIRIGEPSGELLTTWSIKKSQTQKGIETISIPITAVQGTHDLFFQFKTLRDKDATLNLEWVLFYDALPGVGQPGYATIERHFLNLLNSNGDEVIKTPVMVELTNDYRRKTRVFEKGNWMVHGEEVKPGVPEVMNPMPDGVPANRLGFSQWLTDQNNPLTARVMVNRLWAQLFGNGIVKTQEDFGSTGSPPSHPELLDWLAQEFMQNHNWSIKSQLKQIVMSATYQQSSKITPELNEIDPDNRMLARGPRVRLNAEQVRDQGLMVSGLLSDKMYGPSVMPVQPEGLWQTVYSGMKWETSSGEDQHRRALYTFWRRTNPYPSLDAFDSPSKNFCVVRRINTNTPLQAFVTLNDPAYVEMAKGLAVRIMETGEISVDEQIKEGFRLAMARDIKAEELQELQLLYEQSLHHFKKDPEAAEKLLNKKDIELASLTMVASVIMNLDEFITKL